MRTFWPGGLGSNFTLRRRISLLYNAYVTSESPHVQEIRHREIKQGHQQYTAEDNADRQYPCKCHGKGDDSGRSDERENVGQRKPESDSYDWS